MSARFFSLISVFYDIEQQKDSCFVYIDMKIVERFE